MKVLPGFFEERIKMIDWINQQDIFRTYMLYEYMEVTPKGLESDRIRKALRVLRTLGYIQGLEKDQYVFIKKIGYDFDATDNYSKKAKIEEYIKTKEINGRTSNSIGNRQ